VGINSQISPWQSNLLEEQDHAKILDSMGLCCFISAVSSNRGDGE
jgi:hypothetical protein